MPKAATNGETSRTATIYEARRPISATGSPSVSVTKPQSQRSDKKIETAVYTYIRALRSLGKTQVNTAEIAKALGLPISTVDSVLPKLSEKGIRRAG
jgi:DNA-binding MarR family transcriptional regulator